MPGSNYPILDMLCGEPTLQKYLMLRKEKGKRITCRKAAMNAILGDLKEKVRDRLSEKNLYMWLVGVKYDLMAHNQLNVYFCQLNFWQNTII